MYTFMNYKHPNFEHIFRLQILIFRIYYSLKKIFEMSASIDLAVENNSSQEKTHENIKEAEKAEEAIFLDAQSEEALTRSVNKRKDVGNATQTQADHTFFKGDSHSIERESLLRMPTPPLFAPTSSTSLHKNYGHTNSKICPSRLNSDSVFQESCSRREFNESSLSIVAVENSPHSSVSALGVSSTTLSSSTSVPLSSSSPSICCYTIASHSKAISKQASRTNSYVLSNSSHQKHKLSRSLLGENFNPNLQAYSSVGKNRCAIPKSIKLKVTPPPVPPKPCKNKRHNVSKTKSQVGQEKSLVEKSYYDPTSFRRKLHKFEKQNTLIGKSKNNVTRASDKDEDDQGDERCEFLGCFSVGNNTNSDQSVSDNSCVGSVKSVSSGERDYDIVYTGISRSNNSTNNINNNNNSDAFDRDRSSCSGGSEWRVNDERKDSIKSSKKTLRYDSFGRLKSDESSDVYRNRTVNTVALNEFCRERSSSNKIVHTALPSAVVIRQLTPKLSKQPNFRTREIISRRCASDDSLISCNKPCAEHQSQYFYNVERKKLPIESHRSGNVLSPRYGYQQSGISSSVDSVSTSAHSFPQVDADVSQKREWIHHTHSPNEGNKIFKSLSDTNNSNRSQLSTFEKSTGVSENRGFHYHSASASDVQDCTLSDLSLKDSLNYLEDKNNLTCGCASHREGSDKLYRPDHCEYAENSLDYRVPNNYHYSSPDSQYQTLNEDNSNSSEWSNLRSHFDTNESLSANSSSSSISLNFSSPSLRGPLVLKRIPAIESFGQIPQSNESGAVCKEIMMEKRRNTLDRWQRLGFGRRSSPSTANQEKAKKSTDKSERLKELTELLRRNRSSPTPPPIPPPRKARHAVSASSSLEKNDEVHMQSFSSQSGDILLMDQDEENTITPTSKANTSQIDTKITSCCSSGDLNQPTRRRLCDSLKPNTSLSSFETLLSSREMSKSPPPALFETEISTKLSRPESRTVIGSYTRKGIPFRSASFSQIDSSKYIGATLGALRDRLRRDKTGESSSSDDKTIQPNIDESNLEENACDEKTEDSFIYIPLKKAEFNISSYSGEDDNDRDTPEVIPEEDYVPDDKEPELECKTSENEKEDAAITEPLCDEGENIVPTNIQLIGDDPSIPAHSTKEISENVEIPEMLEPNLAKLVEEEIPLESPPDNILQTATTCLIPVPVYECAAQEWNLENPPHEWVDVALDEFGIYPDPTNSIDTVEIKFSSEKLESEQLIRENVPIISVSQHSSTQLEEIEENEFEGDAYPLNVSHHSRNHAKNTGSFDYSEVKKRYSHDDMEIGKEKRSSLDCSLQRLCSNVDERKRIDKSKRRKGMYIESTDWKVESPEAPSNRRLDLEVSLANFSKGEQSDESSSIMYLNSPVTEENQTPGSMYSLDLNTPDSECNKPLIWTKPHRRTSLICQSSEEKDDLIPTPHLAHNNQSFLCTESVSDNESDRTPAPLRDRSSPSPALSDQDFKRYSKRPLRGPYGQMLEAEMKKPNRLHFEEVLEELKDPDSLSTRRARGLHHDTRSYDDSPRNIPQYSNSFRVRKSNTHLPIPTHTRAASTPSQIENVTRSTGLSKIQTEAKRYQSTMDNSSSSEKKRISSEVTSNRPIHKKSASLIPLDKQTKRSLDEIRIPSRSPSEVNVLAESSTKVSHGKHLMPSPELLAELLQGASEKLVSEQRQQMFADTRTHVVQEIFRNEQSYVESLQTVVLKYFKVLKMPENAGMIDSRTVDEIFFMVPDILAIHEKFLSELKARLDAWEAQQKVGDAFIETFSKTEVLEVYTSFVNNCNRAKNAIRTTKQSRPSFARFLETTAREHKGKLTLDNLLIKPVQKFPNYEMLFTRLIKHTDSDHPDQKHLQEVLKLVHDILVHINCKEREILENGQREATLRELEGIIEGVTELIAPDRQFLIFDLVSMPSGQGARKERGFFLFNDLLVITSIKRRSGTIRKPNTTSCPGSVASTLDTNKYKFLTKVSLDNLEIIKSKDESLRKIMNEIEQLADDCNKLQQIAEVTAAIKYPHQILEDVIRDLHRDVQRQLSERQSNDAQLNMLELTVNSPNGSQKLSIIFSKAEKRSQWEEAFIEAKQKLAATLERHPIPEFMTSIPIVKTRAGLQFTCAAPTLSEQKDVWVCNSDGYVGQVCVMSLSPEPNVTSCNGVCNARILCLASVPACSESESKGQRSSLNEETTVREFRKSSSPSFLANQSEKKKPNTNVASSDIQLDSNSSSDDSEPENSSHRDRIPSPSPVSVAGSATTHHHQTQDSNPDESDGNQSTMWLGTEDGYIHVYNCTDTIRIKKNKIKIQHASAVYSILYLDNRVFVSLANGDIYVYLRDSVGWNTSSPLCISIGSVSSPVNKLLNVHGRLWCSIQGIIKVLDTKTLQVVNQIQISSDSKPITNMAVASSYVWISIQNSAHIKCFHSNTHQLVTEVNLAPAVNKMLSNCDDIIRQHKAACLRVTSLLSCKDLIWIGTSAGVLLTIPAQGFEKGSPNVVPTGIPHGHTGHVRFLTFVETTPNSSSKSSDECANTDYKNRRSSKHSKTKSETGNILIISGGDGYEDFRNSGANSLSEIAGREDSTNHLLIWQI